MMAKELLLGVLAAHMCGTEVPPHGGFFSVSSKWETVAELPLEEPVV